MKIDNVTKAYLGIILFCLATLFAVLKVTADTRTARALERIATIVEKQK